MHVDKREGKYRKIEYEHTSAHSVAGDVFWCPGGGERGAGSVSVMTSNADVDLYF